MSGLDFALGNFAEPRGDKGHGDKGARGDGESQGETGNRIGCGGAALGRVGTASRHRCLG